MSSADVSPDGHSEAHSHTTTNVDPGPGDAAFRPDTLLTIIKGHGEGLSEYELLQAIYRHHRQPRPSLADPLVLFQQHFCLFHALYRLRDQLHELGQGTLLIDVMNIRWLALAPEHGQQLAVNDSLRSYYLDSGHLNTTDRAGVEQLLDGFWRGLVVDSERAAALALLGLAEPVSWLQIKRCYRRQISACHPDRGGCSVQASRLNRAVAVLERCYRR